MGDTEKPGVERSDASVGRVALIFAAIVVVCSLMLIPMYLLLRGLQSSEARAQAPPLTTTAAGASVLPPEPRLQTTIAGDLKRLHGREDAVLNSYGWVDQERGLVRVPIARALDILAARGLPAREGAGPMPRPWPAGRGSDGVGGSDTHATGNQGGPE